MALQGVIGAEFAPVIGSLGMGGLDDFATNAEGKATGKTVGNLARYDGTIHQGVMFYVKKSLPRALAAVFQGKAHRFVPQGNLAQCGYALLIEFSLADAQVVKPHPPRAVSVKEGIGQGGGLKIIFVEHKNFGFGRLFAVGNSGVVVGEVDGPDEVPLLVGGPHSEKGVVVDKGFQKAAHRLGIQSVGVVGEASGGIFRLVDSVGPDASRYGANPVHAEQGEPQGAVEDDVADHFFGSGPIQGVTDGGFSILQVHGFGRDGPPFISAHKAALLDVLSGTQAGEEEVAGEQLPNQIPGPVFHEKSDQPLPFRIDGGETVSAVELLQPPMGLGGVPVKDFSSE